MRFNDVRINIRVIVSSEWSGKDELLRQPQGSRIPGNQEIPQMSRLFFTNANKALFHGDHAAQCHLSLHEFRKRQRNTRVV